jgi:hypothetical protein
MPVAPPSRETVEKAIELVKRLGNVSAACREMGMAEGTVRNWITNVGPRLYGLEAPVAPPTGAKGRKELSVVDGVIYVASDAHYWPGEASTAHRAFCRFIAREKHLRAVVMNGDACDFASISRHDPTWTESPSTQQELEVVSERLGEIEKASKKVPRYWPLGNHDARLEAYLAKNAPEMKGVYGSSLSDHNPSWVSCFSLYVNDDCVIKHRYKGGLHATANNALWSGRSYVTGHLHSQRVTPITDLNGTRWGCDTGCLADTFGPQFIYMEDNPRNWVSGFARLKWISGRLLTPELIRVVEPGVVEFRGELINV